MHDSTRQAAIRGVTFEEKEGVGENKFWQIPGERSKIKVITRGKGK